MDLQNQATSLWGNFFKLGMPQLRAFHLKCPRIATNRLNSVLLLDQLVDWLALRIHRMRRASRQCCGWWTAAQDFGRVEGFPVVEGDFVAGCAGGDSDFCLRTAPRGR